MDPGRWQQLVLQFRQDNFKLHQLSTNSVFYVVLQAGLSALKTPYPSRLLIYFCYIIILLLYCTSCTKGAQTEKGNYNKVTKNEEILFEMLKI